MRSSSTVISSYFFWWFNCFQYYLDLKNKGIDTTKKDYSKGSDVLNEQILEAVERHAKNSSKEIVQLMQINKAFIVRVCTVLTRRITEASYTAE